jgi:hypothetical protein
MEGCCEKFNQILHGVNTLGHVYYYFHCSTIITTYSAIFFSQYSQPLQFFSETPLKLTFYFRKHLYPTWAQQCFLGQCAHQWIGPGQVHKVLLRT